MNNSFFRYDFAFSQMCALTRVLSVALSISALIQHALIIQLNLCTTNPVSFFGGFEGPLLF